MQKSVQVAKVGRKGFNGRKALADMVTEFLEIISHTVLFNYGGYPAETFDTASYGSILFHKCRVKEVLDYMNSALQTVHRWIRFDELSHFAACILDKDDRVVMEAVIIIMDIQYPQLRNVLTTEAADMKRQFQQTIFTLQRESYIENMKNVLRNEEVRFEIHTKLRGNCEIKLQKRAGEFKWEKHDQCAPENLRPCGKRIDSKLIEIVAMVRQLDET
ncbi:HORMA domain protein [Onchocerca flexuosa]|uniref:HORMA domain protein n=2 Tax=Onchocerca flexuosa TaxID=387005 RepID=A0A238C667_9BILA|nr:HORMA domain protein [Onchocerca flexuosa]